MSDTNQLEKLKNILNQSEWKTEDLSIIKKVISVPAEFETHLKNVSNASDSTTIKLGDKEYTIYVAHVNEQILDEKFDTYLFNEEFKQNIKNKTQLKPPTDTQKKSIEVQNTESELEPLTDTVEDQNKELEPLTETVEDQNKELEPLTETVEDQNKELEPLTETVEDQNKELEPLTETIEDQNKEPKLAENQKNLQGGKKKSKIIRKFVKKHRSVIQLGGRAGKLRKGFKYTGNRTKTGLAKILKL